MDSWWQLGEGMGYRGDELGYYEITCPFCMEEGNFELEHHADKKNPQTEKRLNFDTLKCANCAGYVMVLWSASHFGGGLYDFRVLPWTLRYEKAPDAWPEAVGRYWLQAKRNLADENWDAAALMIRSALQIALREQSAKGKTFKDEIDDLSERGILPPTMKEWAHEVRFLGNDAAHPEPSQDAADPQDVGDASEFLDFLLQYLYSLPHQINQYRERKTKQ